MRKVVISAAIALALSACASTQRTQTPTANMPNMVSWRPTVSVPVKSDAPPRKRVYTGGGGLKVPTL